MTYENLGPCTAEQFEQLARSMGQRTHTFLSDGDRGHKVWCFYADGWKYVCDNVGHGRKK